MFFWSSTSELYLISLSNFFQLNYAFYFTIMHKCEVSYKHSTSDISKYIHSYDFQTWVVYDSLSIQLYQYDT